MTHDLEDFEEQFEIRKLTRFGQLVRRSESIYFVLACFGPVHKRRSLSKVFPFYVMPVFPKFVTHSANRSQHTASFSQVWRRPSDLCLPRDSESERLYPARKMERNGESYMSFSLTGELVLGASAQYDEEGWCYKG